MQDILAGQIERRRNFCPPGGFGIALLLHQLRTGKAQFHTRKGVNGIVDATMVRNIAAGHTAVGSIDNGIALQRGNIALPKVQSRLHRCKVSHIGDTLCRIFALQIGVLHLQKICICALRRTKIHQSPQKLPLSLRLCRNTQIPIFRVFLQKRLNQKQPPLCLVHSFSTAFTGQFS